MRLWCYRQARSFYRSWLTISFSSRRNSYRMHRLLWPLPFFLIIKFINLNKCLLFFPFSQRHRCHKMRGGLTCCWWTLGPIFPGPFLFPERIQEDEVLLRWGLALPKLVFAVDKDPVLTARGRVVGGTLVPGRLSIQSCLKLIDFDLTKTYFLSLVLHII